MNMETLSILAIACSLISLLCLTLLHFVSPQYKPSWRMISEYAYGKNKIILTLFFIFWGIGTLLTAALLFKNVSNSWATFGVILVGISGIGAIMGGLFDIKHKLHGLSFLLGVPTLPAGALLVAYHLIDFEKLIPYKTSILWSSHLVWISLVLMAISMMMMFNSFKKAGVSWDKNSEPPETLPSGVVAYGGYANRLLVVCYIWWTVYICSMFL